MTPPQETPMNVWTGRITRWLTVLLHWVSAHWLFIANLAIGLQAGLPILAPVLMHAGYERAANLIYLVSRPLCHQLPERSFFLFGKQWTYSLQELAALSGLELVPVRYIGNAYLGFKMAICQRCVSTYLAMLLFGMLFALLRGHLRSLSLKQFGLMVLPLVIDGCGQLFGLWTSTWVSRVITGGQFGVAAVWLTFPYLEQGMAEVQQGTTSTL